MIDKKPFRVTNEQVKNIVNAIYSGGQDMTKKNLAVDLLDSRELIAKQEATIKEMRHRIAVLINVDNIIPPNVSMELAQIIIDSKDYA